MIKIMGFGSGQTWLRVQAPFYHILSKLVHFSKPLILEVWSMDQQLQHHLEIRQNHRPHCRPTESESAF